MKILAMWDGWRDEPNRAYRSGRYSCFTDGLLHVVDVAVSEREIAASRGDVLSWRRDEAAEKMRAYMAERGYDVELKDAEAAQ